MERLLDGTGDLAHLLRIDSTRRIERRVAMDGPSVDTPERVRKVLLERRREMHTRQTVRETATVADIRTPDQVTTELHAKATTVLGPRIAGRSRMAVRRMDRRSINLAAIGW